jgi:hypothetical protein
MIIIKSTIFANLCASTTESLRIKAALLSRPGSSSNFVPINVSIF